MSKTTIKLFARRVQQGDTVFYETALDANDLVNEDTISVDRWNNSSQKGYQREVNEHHVRRIANYMKGNVGNTNVLPSNVIINWRDPFKVTDLGRGLVEIDLQDFPGYVVDGQHRVEAAREVISDLRDKGEDLEGYEFGVTVTNFSLEEEMVHFKNLNTTANRPAKGLSQIIGHQLNTLSGVAPTTWTEQATNRAVALTVRLATDIESPWYGKIAIGGIRKRNFHITVQASMVTSLLPLFTNGRFSDPKMSSEHIYQSVLAYWKAVETVWPEAMANPDASTIQRTSGLNPLNKIMNKIFNNLIINPIQSDFEKILKDIRSNLSFEDEDWATGNSGKAAMLRAGYSNNKGMNIITDYLWSGVSEATKRSFQASGRSGLAS